MKLETVEKIVELLNEKKKVYKSLADDYKDRYNNNKGSNKAICRNMYYQNIYRYNEAEDTLAEIEGRQPKMYCFTLPPFIDLPKILAEYEKFRWHDLRKDPNDLPVRRCVDNDGNVVRLFHNSWDKKLTWYRYDFHECEWWQMETEPIAWCEIPEYTEE